MKKRVRDAREKKEMPLEEGLLELAGLETRKEAETVRRLGKGWAVGRLTWDQTLGMEPVPGLDG